MRLGHHSRKVCTGLRRRGQKLLGSAVECAHGKHRFFNGLLALEREFIARDLPFIKREAVIAIKKDYDSHEAAKRGIAADVDGFYREEYPDLATQRAGDIAEAGRILGVIYANNVYPTMKIGWDTYPDHIGHEKGPGCFRCHSGSHVTDDGETISDECEDCHALVAMDEASPDILKMLP